MSAPTNFQVTGCNGLQTKIIVFTLSYGKAQNTKNDLAVKYVKFNPGSSFEQTMMGWSPRCYIPSFVDIGQPVLEKKIFYYFFHHIWVWQPSLSCDPDAANKLAFSLPNEAPYKIKETLTSSNSSAVHVKYVSLLCTFFFFFLLKTKIVGTC